MEGTELDQAEKRRSKRAKVTPVNTEKNKGTPLHVPSEELEADLVLLRRKQSAVNESETRIILFCYTRLRLEQALDRERQRKVGGKVRKGNLCTEVAKLTGIGRNTVGSIVARWNRSKREEGKGRIDHQKDRRGHNTKRARIPNNDRNSNLVRDFVTEERRNDRRVTATQVLEMLIKFN